MILGFFYFPENLLKVVDISYSESIKNTSNLDLSAIVLLFDLYGLQFHGLHMSLVKVRKVSTCRSTVMKMFCLFMTIKFLLIFWLLLSSHWCLLLNQWWGTIYLQQNYPRTSCIRKGWVVRQLIKLVIFTGLMGFIIEQVTFFLFLKKWSIFESLY